MRAERTLRRGGNAIEFALILPVLLLLVAGVVDFAYWMHLSDSMVVSVADAARVAQTTDHDGVDDAPELAALEAAQASWEAQGFTSTPEFNVERTGAAPDIFVTVSGNTDYEPFFGLASPPAEIAFSLTVRINDQ